jgi:AAA+ ATPase superfamily predicted ATPase
MAGWKFYGRREQLANLERIIRRQRWFFVNVTGRRRIGKTALIREAIRELTAR